MASAFSRDVLKVVVAQICQTIGWHAIQSTPLDIMIDLLHRYIKHIGKVTHRYSEAFGHTVPNLDDVGLAFQDMGINLLELEEYIRNVDSVPCIYEIPKYPIPRDSHLNFLKPGSREVVTRPVHVHEHLPPMHPEMEEEDYGTKQTPLTIDTASTSGGATSPLASPKGNVFKRPGDPISLESPAVKRARLMLEEEGRPLREISSVMMTTSGFLSPAREGKLPESRTPLQPSDSRSNSPQPSSYPMVPPEVKGDKKTKKILFKKSLDGIKKIGDKENKKKDHKGKELNKVEKQNPADDSKVKKLVGMKELSKLKPLKPGALKMIHTGSLPGTSTSGKPPKPIPPKTFTTKMLSFGSKHTRPISQIKSNKIDKNCPVSLPSPQHKISLTLEKFKDSNIVEGKLSSEPDKQKLNIFKKISKVKEEKSEKLDKCEHLEIPTRDSRESSPGLIIDESEASNKQKDRMAQIADCIESVIQRSMEQVDKPINSSNLHTVETSLSKLDETINDVVSGHNSGPSSDHDVYIFDDDLSPPGTPSTPKTPELPPPRKIEKSQEPKEKKRKRDKTKSKKESKVKSSKGAGSPKKLKLEVSEPETNERPRTPEAMDTRESTITAPVFPFFPHFPPAPGLIPPPIGHPLFPRFPLPLNKNLPHPAMPNLPMPPPLFMQTRADEAADHSTAEKPTSVSLTLQPPLPIHTTKIEKPEKALTLASVMKEKPPEKVSPTPEVAPAQQPPPPALPPTPPLCMEIPTSESSVSTGIGQQLWKNLKMKEHKKEKKERDKTKKKKDKKEKSKGKERSEKKRIKLEKKEKDKGKIKEKKEKKERRREKDALAAISNIAAPISVPSVSSTTKREEKNEVLVPKITFRLGPTSPRPPTPDAQPRKIVIKPVVKKQSQSPQEEGMDRESLTVNPAPDVSLSCSKREPSPELARISALITRPPKQKSASKAPQLKPEPLSEGPLTQFSIVPSSSPSSLGVGSSMSPVPSGPGSLLLVKTKKSIVKPVPKLKGKELVKKMGLGMEMEPPKEPVAYYYDNDGNKVWICPACKGQDDGSPMIGCDDCDAWYHWVCVGIQVPPDENEDWYCRVCIVKKQENIAEKKKKSRKKKLVT